MTAVVLWVLLASHLAHLKKNRSVPLVHLIEILIRNFAEKMPFTRYLLFEMGFVETGIDTWLGIRNL